MRTDILLGVALIHEIGHFYDFDKGLRKAVYDSFTDGIKDGSINPNDYAKYFPNGLKEKGTKPPKDLIFYATIGGTTKELEIDEPYCLSHMGEFIADLFAAQYVGMHIFGPIDYGSSNPDKDSPKHPSNNLRKEMIQDFLSNKTTNTLLNCIKDNFGDDVYSLVVRFTDIIDDKYVIGDSIDIDNDESLFTLLNRAWNLYESGPDEMSKKSGNSISYFDLYNGINQDFSIAINNYLK